MLAALSAALFADLRHHDWAFDDEDFVANARIAQDHFLHIFAADKPFARQYPDYDSPHTLLLELYAQSRGYPPDKIGAQLPATLADSLRADIRAAFQQDQTLQAESLARLYLHYAPGDPQVSPLLIDLFARQHRFADQVIAKRLSTARQRAAGR